MSIINGWKIIQELTRSDGGPRDGCYSFARNQKELDEKKAYFEAEKLTPYRIEAHRLSLQSRGHYHMPFIYEVNDENVLETIGHMGYRVRVHDNPYFKNDTDKYGVWEVMMEAARKYLVGDNMTTEKFVRKYTSPLSDWQFLAREWLLKNPDKLLCISPMVWNKRFDWEVYVRGDLIEYALPHHDAGGERHYASKKSGSTKVLTDID